MAYNRRMAQAGSPVTQLLNAINDGKLNSNSKELLKDVDAGKNPLQAFRERIKPVSFDAFVALFGIAKTVLDTKDLDSFDDSISFGSVLKGIESRDAEDQASMAAAIAQLVIESVRWATKNSLTSNLSAALQDEGRKKLIEPIMAQFSQRVDEHERPRPPVQTEESHIQPPVAPQPQPEIAPSGTHFMPMQTEEHAEQYDRPYEEMTKQKGWSRNREQLNRQYQESLAPEQRVDPSSPQYSASLSPYFIGKPWLAEQVVRAISKAAQSASPYWKERIEQMIQKVREIGNMKVAQLNIAGIQSYRAESVYSLVNSFINTSAPEGKKFWDALYAALVAEWDKEFPMAEKNTQPTPAEQKNDAVPVDSHIQQTQQEWLAKLPRVQPTAAPPQK